MDHNLSQTIALLARTPATLNALLCDLPEAWTMQNEGENTWSAYDVLDHLVYVERGDWIPRIKIVLEVGETQTLEPVDRLAHSRETQRKTLPQLLDKFAWQRSENLEELRALNLQPADLKRCGQHRALGPITLSALLATWAVHDLTHLHQVSRILAHQYRDAVGPWNRYLGVLQCAGHSSA
jgi:DinB superfamily